MSDEYGSVTAKPAAPTEDTSSTGDPVSSQGAPSEPATEDEEISRLGPNYRRDPGTQGLVYTDPQTGQELVLNADKTDWVPRTATSSSSEGQCNYSF